MNVWHAWSWNVVWDYGWLTSRTGQPKLKRSKQLLKWFKLGTVFSCARIGAAHHGNQMKFKGFRLLKSKRLVLPIAKIVLQIGMLWWEMNPVNVDQKIAGRHCFPPLSLLFLWSGWMLQTGDLCCSGIPWHCFFPWNSTQMIGFLEQTETSLSWSLSCSDLFIDQLSSPQSPDVILTQSLISISQSICYCVVGRSV